MKTFKFWTFEDVEDTFNLKTVSEDYSGMKVWFDSKYELLQEREVYCKQLSKKLLQRVNEWNEEELKIWFIGPILQVVDFDTNLFKGFLDRPLSVKINNETVVGKVDLLIARGKLTPKKPLFFLHEYKPAKSGDSEPLGQLLIAMVAAQQVNDEKYPLYGCYVVGRNWYFVLLDGNNYCVSNAYNATDFSDLKNILNALFYVKEQLKKIPQ